MVRYFRGWQGNAWAHRLRRFVTLPAFPDSPSIPTLSQCEFLLVYAGLVILVLLEVWLLYGISEKMRALQEIR